MNLFIITGASKGLGLSLLEKALADGHTAITFSRTKGFTHPAHIHISCDLSKTKTLPLKLEKALTKVDLKKVKSIYLVNNAAVIEPIGDIHDFSIEAMEKHLKINLLTPMTLTSLLMKKVKTKKCPITIVNIVSGAAYRPLINWSQYCSTKSGLKMFTDCLNLDYQERKDFKAISFSPGVMDTSMQSTIRSQSKKNFKNIERFKQLKQKNQLLSPDTVADRLYTLIKVPRNLNDTHYDVKDL